MASSDSGATPLLEVRGLSVSYGRGANQVDIVRGVDLTLREGETLALVGESGSGKSVTSMALMGLVPQPPFRVGAQAMRWTGRDGVQRDLASASNADWQALRGNEIAMIFQDPMTSLNPVMRIGDQIAESVILHQRLGRKAALQVATDMLDLVGIPDATRRVGDYPHQLSGGMRQRVMIASALSCKPRLLLADEPTTALDVTIQAQILDLLARLQDEFRMAVLFVTHDLGVVSAFADRVAVMYAGQIVETADAATVISNPAHPYMRGLLRSLPPATSDSRVALEPIPGSVPDLRRLPAGCPFHPRCRHAVAGRCDTAPPPLKFAQPQHGVRCLRVGELPTWEAP